METIASVNQGGHNKDSGIYGVCMHEEILYVSETHDHVILSNHSGVGQRSVHCDTIRMHTITYWTLLSANAHCI